ncbi:MAG: transposase, partial [Bacillota bacterium]
VYIGSSWKDITYKNDEDLEKTICMRIGYEITERSIDKHGQILLLPDIQTDTWWTNLGVSDDEVIALYHAHGESEQYHSEIKTDMDVERLPSRKFETNELVLELTIIAYNILRMIGQASLKSKKAPKTKHPVKRRRLRTVIGNLILIAGHVTTHARKVILALGCSNIWRYTFMELYRKFSFA